MIDLISTSGGKPVIFMPLAFIVAVSAAKDLFEDRKRHQEDSLENNKSTMKYVNGHFVEVPWHSLRVGDIIKVFLFRLILFPKSYRFDVYRSGTRSLYQQI